MKNHFIFPYTGNKREEVEEIYKHLELTNIQYIVEPFCGTSAMSYYISLKHPKKYTYILNDNNKDLIKLYNIIKDPIHTNFFNCMLELLYKYINKQETHDMKKHIYVNALTGVHKYYIHNKFYTMRPGLFPLERIKKMKYQPLCGGIIDFCRNENIIFRNDDAKEIIIEYNNKNALFFIDPPYLQACNAFYANAGDLSIYQFILLNTENIINMYLILEYTWMIERLFHEYSFIKYEKKYRGVNKKTATHCIIRDKKIS